MININLKVLIILLKRSSHFNEFDQSIYLILSKYGRCDWIAINLQLNRLRINLIKTQANLINIANWKNISSFANL